MQAQPAQSFATQLSAILYVPPDTRPEQLHAWLRVTPAPRAGNDHAHPPTPPPGPPEDERHV